MVASHWSKSPTLLIKRNAPCKSPERTIGLHPTIFGSCSSFQLNWFTTNFLIGGHALTLHAFFDLRFPPGVYSFMSLHTGCLVKFVVTTGAAVRVFPGVDSFMLLQTGWLVTFVFTTGTAVRVIPSVDFCMSVQMGWLVTFVITTGAAVKGFSPVWIFSCPFKQTERLHLLSQQEQL